VSTAPTLPYGRQLIDDDDVAAVTRVLRGDFLTTGPEVPAFEAELAAICGARHAVAVCNGTAALHCAYVAIGLAPGDEVITTPLTFSATANTLLAMGARPRFVDIDPGTLNLDPVKVADAIGPLTRAIAPVDFAGLPAVTDELRELARARGLKLVEDAAHAIGGKVGARPVGSLADVTTFSFHPVKTITTGEGGAVLTDDDTLAQRARDFRNHGLVRDRERLGRWDGPWYYEVQSVGLNYRLTDLQCALGRSQLAKLDRFVARRAQIVARYREAFSDEPRLGLQRIPEGVAPGWHLFTVQLPDTDRRARFFASLQAQRIAPQVHYIAVNDLPLYRAEGYHPSDTPLARAAADRLVSLPLFPAMTDDDVERVIHAVRVALDAP
jgi:UDP-4-amino-4,6-dideoxy-N-acetyl-beta-L-altrosamine transaminase